MSFSDVKLAQKYASIAEVAAAECKIFTEEARKAPQYTNEAKFYAESAESSAQAANSALAATESAASGASANAQSAQESSNNASASEQSASNYADSSAVSAQEANDSKISAEQYAEQASQAVTKTLRVDDVDLPVLPDAADRANKVLSCDSSGNFQFTVPASGSAADVLNQLAADDGSDYIGTPGGVLTGVISKIENKLDGELTFSSGGVLNSIKDFIWHDQKKSWFYWTGEFPKSVQAGDSPDGESWNCAGDLEVREYSDNTFQPLTLKFATITDAMASELLDGAIVEISAEPGYPPSKYICTSTAPSLGHIVYKITDYGKYLVPYGGAVFNGNISPSLSYTTVHLAEIGLITDSAVQGTYWDSRANSVLLGFSRKFTNTSGENEVTDIYEYAFNDGVFGSLINTFSGIPAGHGDYFCVVYRAGARCLLFQEPKTTLSSDSFSGGYISYINLAASNPLSTKQRLIDLSSDISRQTVGAYGDKIWINRVGISSNVCDVNQVFSGQFKPLVTVPWSSLSDSATITIPEQNFVASPVGDGTFMAVTGAESQKKGHCWLTNNVPYKNLQATPIYWNAVYSEPETLFHYWSTSGDCYKTILLSWEWSTQSLRVTPVQGTGGFGWKLHQVNYPGRTYNSWGGNVSVAEVTNILSAKQGIAVGGQLGSADDFTPTDLMIEQWSSSATGRSGGRIQYGKTPYTSSQILLDEYNDSTYPHGWRFTTTVDSATSPVLQVTKDHVLIGAFASKSQMLTNPYKDFMLQLRPASKDYCGIFIDSSAGKPGVVTSSSGATIASTASALRFGGYTVSSGAFDQYLQILSTGYTWNVPSASDRRLKYDIEYLLPESCLDRVLKMKPADYSRIRDKKRARGFIAQDANNADRLLGERNNGVYGVHFEAVAADNTGAIIALNNKIEELKIIINQLLEEK